MGLAAISPKSDKSLGRQPLTDKIPSDTGLSARNAAPEPKTRTIEVVLPDERQSELVFNFKAPNRDILLASANRLLKFEFPPIKEVKVFERLIKTNVLSTGLSKKVLEALPLPFLENIYSALWESLFEKQDPILNDWLALFLLVEAMQEFTQEQMVLDDIALLGLRDTGTMHSYYYQGSLNRESVIALLSGHGYRTDFLQELNASEQEHKKALTLAYLACRWLNRPLSWSELLASLETDELTKFPRLARLKSIQSLLEQKRWTASRIQPDNLFACVHQLQQLLHQPALADIASQHMLPRPVKTLVIVEGETEKLLLPLFAGAMTLDLHALGIDILPAGGKNHVLALYGKYIRFLNAPICVVLDNDAAEIAQELGTLLRPQDYVFQIEDGEFEDLYDLNLILKTINLNYQPYPEVTRQSFQELADAHYVQGRVQTLKVLWQAYNLGSFDKIEFANQYAELLKPGLTDGKPRQPPAAIRKLVQTILNVHAGKE